MTNQVGSNAKFRFLRVNPFRGLLVDENTWADAHDYHRNQMRFHLLALHGAGIVQGLEVVAMQPPDMRLTIRPGAAIDPEGRLLLLTEQQIISVAAPSSVSTVFITLEFSEKVTQMQNVTEGGKPQAARVLEECTARASLEVAPNCVELARINLEATSRQVRNASSARQAGNNEIDLSGRVMVADRSGGSSGGKQARTSLTLGVLRYGAAGNVDWKRHTEGLRRLLRDTSASSTLDGSLLEGVSLMDEAALRNCKMLYITGRAAFRFTPEEEQSLRRFLERSGVLWCEPCRSGLANGTPDDFSRSCIELSQRLNRQPIQPRVGHPLFTARYLFATSPQALDPAGVVVEANRMIITTGDYGCLWEGRGQERAEPPSREVLRSAQEFGANALFLAAGQS
ncbi:MAG: DUF4159 domain-containing protein [Chloroflexota bacterium]|nr:DUF4159 domain-containing protein [Chloroflexota bacterium]